MTIEAIHLGKGKPCLFLFPIEADLRAVLMFRRQMKEKHPSQTGA
jgi:hypothetical protein